VHSERTPAALRGRGARMHGLQSWIALPREHEEMAPSFEHQPRAQLPTRTAGGLVLCVLAVTAYGLTAPTRVLSPTLYVSAQLEEGAVLELEEGHEERAFYVVEGRVEHAGLVYEAGVMLVLDRVAASTLSALTPTRLVLIGGAALDGPRHIEWNFVSSSQARIDQAKADWKEGRFPLVPGDEHERVPLPE